MTDRKLVQRLAFLIEKAKTRCFVNDARGTYDILKAALEEVPVDPLDLTEEDPAPSKMGKE
jgi:hypothetical protein